MGKYDAINKEREQYPVLKQWAYFESAGTGLVPAYVYDANQEYRNQRYLVGSNNTWGSDNVDSLTMIDRAKCHLAEMIGCEKGDIVFGMNTTHILSYFTANYELKGNENIIVSDNLFISNKYLLQIRESQGLTIKYVKSNDGYCSPVDYEALIDDNTIAILVDYVASNTGIKSDMQALGDLCVKYNLYYLIDGAQAVGVQPINVQAIHADVLATNDYKWMQNFNGYGFGYVSPRVRKSISVHGCGWMADEVPFDITTNNLRLRQDGGMYDYGCMNTSEIYGLGLVAQRYNQLGGHLIADYVTELRDYLVQQASQVPQLTLQYSQRPQNTSQIVVFTIDSKCQLTYNRLLDYNVRCGVTQLNDQLTTIRIGIHYYNNKEDVNQLIATIQAIIKGE